MFPLRYLRRWVRTVTLTHFWNNGPEAYASNPLALLLCSYEYRHHRFVSLCKPKNHDQVSTLLSAIYKHHNRLVITATMCFSGVFFGLSVSPTSNRWSVWRWRQERGRILCFDPHFQLLEAFQKLCEGEARREVQSERSKMVDARTAKVSEW